MSERERPRTGGGGPAYPTVEGDVDIQGQSLKERPRIRKGATAADAIEEVRKQANLGSLSQWTIRLNDQTLRVDENGKLLDNPHILENFTLSFLKRIQGGLLGK